MTSSKRIIVVAEKSRAYGRALCEGIASFAQEQDEWMLQLIDDITEKDLRGFRGCAGVIARIIDDRTAALLQSLKVPVVDILVLKRYAGIAAVDNDQRLVGAWAADYFLEHRFTRFAFCGYSGVAFSDQRGEGFAEGVRAKGFDCAVFALAGKTTQELAKRGISDEHLTLGSDCVRLGAWLKQLPKPTAVFCCHDARAYQVLTLCKQQGLRVPGEVAVMGVDDDRVLCGFASPTLSSIDPNAIEIGRAAARTLADMIRHPRRKRPPCVRVPPKALVPRASTRIYPIDPPWLSDALLFVGKNFSKGINADDVFRSLGRSHTGVEQAFRDVLGTTVHREIVRVRLEAAARLLQTTDASAAAISGLVGFASPQHFSFTFRKAYGTTPEAYRRQSRAGLCAGLQKS